MAYWVVMIDKLNGENLELNGPYQTSAESFAQAVIVNRMGQNWHAVSVDGRSIGEVAEGLKSLYAKVA